MSGGGKMGTAIVEALGREDDLEAVAIVDAFATADRAEIAGRELPVFTDPAGACDAVSPDVAIDFTNALFTPALVDAAIPRGVRPVIGTSGITPAYLDQLGKRCADAKLGAVYAANFAVGAVLMMHMAAIAARFMDSAEIIELHHDQKVDAPSGTAMATARAMIEARGRPFERNEPEQRAVAGARAASVDGVTIHSVRLPGLVAHQEVLLGGAGQTLSIRHDSLGRDSFMPGIILATREVMRRDSLLVGLDSLLGLT